MADEAPDDERRTDPRHPIELKVEYKRLNLFFADYTKNISRGGTFIKTNRPLPIGTEFVFKLYVARLPAPIEIRGEVQWIVTEEESAARGEEPGMGIRFVYRDRSEETQVLQVVEKLMVDSLGQRLYTKLMDPSRDRK